MRGSANTIPAVAPYLIEHLPGKTTRVSSICSTRPRVSSVRHLAARWGLMDLPKSAVPELWQYGINANVGLGGLTPAPTAAEMRESHARRISPRKPLGRARTSGEVPKVVSTWASGDKWFAVPGMFGSGLGLADVRGKVFPEVIVWKMQCISVIFGDKRILGKG